MPFIIAIGIAYVAYAAKNKGENSDESENDALPPLDPQVLEGKRAVDLLPLERTISMFEAPIATITFMDGNPKVAASYLKKRVGSIVYRNPWLGGWLAQDKNDYKAVKLFYDASSDHVQDNLFEALEVGQVALTRDTPYKDIGALLEPHHVLVRHNSHLIGKDGAPLFRVVVIPDAASPDSRFALVVSLSHMVGDGHTFFAVQNMLHSNVREGNNNGIMAMDPNRRPEVYAEQLVEKVGKDDAYLVARLSKTPMFARKRDETVIERRAFFLNTEWIEAQKEKWESVLAQGSGGSGGEGSSRSNDFKVSFAAHDRATDKLTTSDIVTSWFFRKVDATIGLLACNLRQDLPSYSKENAGNFVTHIPFTSSDYASPMLIQQGRKQIRRLHAEENPLPQHSLDNRYAISVDWRAFQREGGLVLGDYSNNNDDEQSNDPEQQMCRQVLQLPCYQMKDLECIPKTFSSIQLFNAGPLGEVACACIAPVTVLQKMEESGMILSTIGQTTITEREDGFADAVNDALEGRRQSRYAVILDESLRNIQLE